MAGGSRAFARAIADRYARLGGIVRYNARVVSVTVENGRATGVRCADGAVVPGSTVVSCADGHTTIFQMLGGRFVSNSSGLPDLRPFPPLIQVSLGINRTFAGAPHPDSAARPTPVVDDKHGMAGWKSRCFFSDSMLCPEGRTVMTVRLPPARLLDRPERQPSRPLPGREAAHSSERHRRLTVDFRAWPPNLEFSDVATPATFARHTGNWRGSYEGWLPTPRILGRRMPYAAGAYGFLHGRPLGRGGWGTALRRARRPICRADDLRPQGKSVHGNRCVNNDETQRSPISSYPRAADPIHLPHKHAIPGWTGGVPGQCTLWTGCVSKISITCQKSGLGVGGALR